MRVLAVTSNASLVVALGSMMREWEVVTVRDLDHAASEGLGSSVALIDLGETAAGLDMALQLHRNGVTVPCVVVGDVPNPDATATVLVRPFSLEDLGAAVREAASNPVRASVAAPAAPAVVPVAETTVVDRAPAPSIEPLPERAAGNGSAAAAPLAEPEPESPGAEPEPEPIAGIASEPVVEEPLVEAVPEPVVQSYASPSPAAPQPAWEEPDPKSLRPVFHEPQPVEPAKAGWRKRKRDSAQPPQTAPETEAPIVRRLKVAALHALELEDLISQMPFLADLPEMAAGLIGEIDRQFVCAIASVTVRRPEGFAVVAHRGLSRVESGMVVPETQPLFSDVLKTRDGVLIQPVDLAQGLVAGIGGARTEAMMFAPAIVNDQCVAIVVVGGDSFTAMDLDRLSDLAAEAAPGLAVALLLDRLRNLY